MTPKHDVVVVGGGVVGAALALALRRHQVDVALVERVRAPKPFDPSTYDLRVYAISPGSARFLAELGVWDKLASQRVSPYEQMRVWHDGPQEALTFNAAEHRLAELGWIVENDLMLDVLWKALSGVPVYAAAVTEFIPTSKGAMLALDDGRELRAGLVAAADGADSRLRALAEIGTTGWDYPQQAIVCNVATERPHERTALQRFLPTGPLAFLPLADGRSSIVWSTTQADELMQLDDAQFRARLGDAIEHALGEIGEITRRVAFPLRLLHAERYVQGPLVLLGDAAHVVHPLAGQGVNLGLADAQLLATIIATRASPRALQRYQRARKAENVEMLALTDALNRAFAQSAPMIGATLQLGMRMLDRFTPLKAGLARRALGLTVAERT